MFNRNYGSILHRFYDIFDFENAATLKSESRSLKVIETDTIQ